jgi:thioesterase domain-containing protein
MAVTVRSAQPDRVVLAAPLQPNINHRDTAFGGSISALAMLAAWSLLHTRLRRERVAARLVIQRNTVDYERPVAGEFVATATVATELEWQNFLRMLNRKGKARIAVSTTLEYAGLVAASFTGEFVAIRERAS